MKRKAVVGELINFRGLVYAPINEQGVVFLFGKVAHEFGMYVELIRTGYPDCIAKRFIGRGRWEEIKIEFEFRSSDFVRHKHKIEDVDMIVCWEHDWSACPKQVEILELREEIKSLENLPIEVGDKASKTSDEEFKKNLLSKGTKESLALFKGLDEKIHRISDGIYNRAHKSRIYYYSPKRLFLAIKIMKRGLNIHLFTNAKRIKGVEKFSGEYGFKWGRLYVLDKKAISTATAAVKKSFQQINFCIENKIPTGWYAEPED